MRNAAQLGLPVLQVPWDLFRRHLKRAQMIHDKLLQVEILLQPHPPDAVSRVSSAGLCLADHTQAGRCF